MKIPRTREEAKQLIDSIAEVTLPTPTDVFIGDAIANRGMNWAEKRKAQGNPVRLFTCISAAAGLGLHVGRRLAAEPVKFIHPDEGPDDSVAVPLLKRLEVRPSEAFYRAAAEVFEEIQSQWSAALAKEQAVLFVEAVAAAMEGGYAYGAAAHCPNLVK